VIAAAIPDATLLPADECFAQEIPEPVYDGLTCPNYSLWDSNEAETGSRLTNASCAMSLNSNHVGMLILKMDMFYCKTGLVIL
jgi:hypothetical protein